MQQPWQCPSAGHVAGALCTRQLLGTHAESGQQRAQPLLGAWHPAAGLASDATDGMRDGSGCALQFSGAAGPAGQPHTVVTPKGRGKSPQAPQGLVLCHLRPASCTTPFICTLLPSPCIKPAMTPCTRLQCMPLCSVWLCVVSRGAEGMQTLGAPRHQIAVKVDNTKFVSFKADTNKGAAIILHKMPRGL